MVAQSSKSVTELNVEFAVKTGGNYNIQFALDGASKNCGGAGLMVKK